MFDPSPSSDRTKASRLALLASSLPLSRLAFCDIQRIALKRLFPIRRPVQPPAVVVVLGGERQRIQGHGIPFGAGQKLGRLQEGAGRRGIDHVHGHRLSDYVSPTLPSNRSESDADEPLFRAIAGPNGETTIFKRTETGHSRRASMDYTTSNSNTIQIIYFINLFCGKGTQFAKPVFLFCFKHVSSATKKIEKIFKRSLMIIIIVSILSILYY